MAITPSTPSAADDAWSTPARPTPPVVGAVPREQANVPGGQAIVYQGDPDAGGRDDVADSVAGAVSNAMARQADHETGLWREFRDRLPEDDAGGSSTWRRGRAAGWQDTPRWGF
jgi:hypothetical protein